MLESVAPCVCVCLSLSLCVCVCVRVFFCMTLTSRNLCELRKCCCRFRGSSERNVHLAGTVRVAGRLAGHSSRRERRIIWKLRRHLTVQLKSDALDHELASRVLFSLACSYVLWLAHGASSPVLGDSRQVGCSSSNVFVMRIG